MIFFTIILFMMLSNSGLVTEGARSGLLLWYQNVVPTLFPFMILSGLIISSGIVAEIMNPVYHILHPLFHLSKEGCYVLLCGLFCGCPMGAKTCKEFYDAHKICRSEAMFLMAICNHASPMFLLGYLFPYYSDHITSFELLFCVYAPVIVLAFTASRYYVRNRMDLHSDLQTENMPGSGSLDDMILSSVEVLCKIAGYLVIFSSLVLFIETMNWLPSVCRIGLIGLFEMTTGIREFRHLQPWTYGFLASVASLTFGGLSGLFQVRSVLNLNEKKAGLSIRPYIIWKSAHAILSTGLAFGLCIYKGYI